MTEKYFIKAGLVDLNTLNKDIKVDLKYGSSDNFMNENMYGDLHKAFLERKTAECVVNAQLELSKILPGYKIVIYDAARPLSIQRYMYERVKGTPQENYVASDIGSGGFHNYGLAVDMSILDPNEIALDMGSGFDYFGRASHPFIEPELLRDGLISPEAVENRKILYKITSSSGLYPHPNEWWHYQYYLNESDKKSFNKLDF